MEEDDITEEEHDLAEKLRGLCTREGEERPKTLEESADVLFELGKLYLAKATSDGCTGIPQKLCFIRSAALLIGAKVRYKIKKRDEKVQAMQETLSKFSSYMFEAAGRRNICDEVFTISAGFKKELERMRKEMKDEIEKLSRVSDDAEGEHLIQQENLKIREIQNMMKRITKRYKELMQRIAEKCLELLGEAHCKFAMVGLGSLAREEITLYSDFEHVIVLEDAVVDRPNYPEIREYFRWFAVIFQIIIIGFGETFIRSVGVKSINDLYTEDRSKNWFYDAFTPCGVSFDGMVPHSCNNPLGRQEPTKNRPHTVELIQTASKMATFLCSEESIKNGYYLKDVLTRTCLVYGDEETYDCFKTASIEILTSGRTLNLAKEYIDKTLHNVNHSIQRANRACYYLEIQDYKTVLYRPVTVFLSYLARFFNIFGSSSFDMIDKLHTTSVPKRVGPLKMDLRDTPIIDSDILRQLKFAVAIACEIRVKTYASTSNQRHGLKPADVVMLVGVRSAMSSRKTLQYLTYATKKLFACTRPMTDTEKNERRLMVNTPVLGTCSFQTAFNEKHPLEEAEALLTFGYENEALKLVQTSLRPGIEREASLCQLAAQIYITKAYRDPIHSDIHWKNALKLQNRALNATDPAPDEVLDSYEGLAGSYLLQKDYKKALEMAEKWLRRSKSASGFVPDEDQVSGIQHIKLTSEIKLQPFENKVEQLRSRVNSEISGSLAKHVGALGLAEAYIKRKQPEEARKELKTLIQDIHDNASYDKTIVHDYGHKILDIQLQHRWFKDALGTIKLTREILFRGGKRTFDFSEFDRYFQRAKIACFSNLGKFCDCMCAIENASDAVKKEEMATYAKCIMAQGVTRENVEKTIEICKQNLDNAECVDFYALTLTQVLSGEQFNTNPLEKGTLYRDAPYHVRTHKHIHNLLLRVLKEICEASKNSACQKVILNLLVLFDEYLADPVFAYLFCHCLKRHFADHELQFWSSFCAEKFFNFHIPHCLKGNPFYENQRALELFICGDMQNCARLLWRIITSPKSEAFFVYRSIRLLYSLTLLCIFTSDLNRFSLVVEGDGGQQTLCIVLS